MKFLLIGLALAFLAWTLGTWWAIRGLEEPKYTVVDKRDGYEIRQYDSYIVAETVVTSGDYSEGLSEGFRAIANYIFGDNTVAEKIAMTVPVIDGKQSEKIAMTTPVLENTEAGKRVVSFVMPSKYTLENIPKPNTSQVVLKEVPSRSVAVLSFGWYGNDSRVQAKKTELLSMLKRDGVITLGTPSSAFYNPPLSMPLLLRNEILVDVAL